LFVSLFGPSFASLCIFFIFIRVFSSLLFSVNSAMMQRIFHRSSSISKMFSFALVCVKRSSLQSFSTFLRVSRSPLTQQSSLAVTMQVCFTLHSACFVAVLLLLYVKFSVAATCSLIFFFQANFSHAPN